MNSMALRAAVQATSRALKSSVAFEALPAFERDGVIEFLKTLQVLPPGTKDRIVNETYHARIWPPLTTTQDRSSWDHTK